MVGETGLCAQPRRFWKAVMVSLLKQRRSDPPCLAWPPERLLSFVMLENYQPVQERCYLPSALERHSGPREPAEDHTLPFCSWRTRGCGAQASGLQWTPAGPPPSVQWGHLEPGRRQSGLSLGMGASLKSWPPTTRLTHSFTALNRPCNCAYCVQAAQSHLVTFPKLHGT
jgi:hypothetical protein